MLLNGIVDSLFIDPINTSANLVGTSLSYQMLNLSKKSLDINQKILDFYSEDAKKDVKTYKELLNSNEQIISLLNNLFMIISI
jgi:ribosomal protein L20